MLKQFKIKIPCKIAGHTWHYTVHPTHVQHHNSPVKFRYSRECKRCSCFQVKLFLNPYFTIENYKEGVVMQKRQSISS